MGKVQDLQQAKNTKNKIGDRIIKLEDDLCRERNSDTVCNKEMRNKYENSAKDSMKLKKKEIEILVSSLINSINHALSSSTWLGEMDSLQKNQTKYENKLNKDVVDEERKSAISNRITKFYDKKYEDIKDVSYYLNILYWICFTVILMIIWWKKRLDDVRYWPMIIMMILFPLIFMKSIIFQLPIVNKQVKIPSLFDYIFENFDHYKIDNIYLTSIILMCILIGVYTLASEWPFKNVVNSVE
tara:strand:+ start:535 stop:1260 length:726 start_codon:yes stop_codon:yes gene_type:complete